LAARRLVASLVGVIWWNNSGEGFACGNIRIRKRRSHRSGLNE
jgi:hypothetical protein